MDLTEQEDFDFTEQEDLDFTEQEDFDFTEQEDFDFPEQLRDFREQDLDFLKQWAGFFLLQDFFQCLWPFKEQLWDALLTDFLPHFLPLRPSQLLFLFWQLFFDCVQLLSEQDPLRCLQLLPLLYEQLLCLLSPEQPLLSSEQPRLWLWTGGWIAMTPPGLRCARSVL